MNDFLDALDSVLPRDRSEDAPAPKRAPARQPSLEDVWSNFTKDHPDLDVDAIVSAVEEIREYSPEVAAQLSPGDLLEVALAYDEYAVGQSDVVGGLQSLQGNDIATQAFVRLVQPDPDELHAISNWLEHNAHRVGMAGAEQAQKVVENAIGKYGELISTDIAKALIAQADPQTPEELEAILRYAASASEEEARVAEESAFDRAFYEAARIIKTVDGEDEHGNKVELPKRDLDFDRIASKASGDEDVTSAYRKGVFLAELDKALGLEWNEEKGELERPLSDNDKGMIRALEHQREQAEKELRRHESS